MKKFNLWILAFLIFLSTRNNFYAQNIVINEILASNNLSIKDEDGTYQDWIELYNNGTSSVNLLGYGLSDDPLIPFKWTFPNVSLGSGKYLIVWASDKNRTGSVLHANFKISADGENILLTNPSGVTVDQIAPVYLQPDISYGRSPNGTGSFVFFGTPTPNAINSTPAFTEALKPPQFSDDPSLDDYAFKTSGFDLSITSSNSGATILYTTDGSEPDKNNLGTGTTYQYKNKYPESPGQPIGPILENSFKTFKYTVPITITDRSSQPNKVSNISTTYDFTPTYFPNGPIFKGTVIKAKVTKPGALSSITVTKNYFISSKGKNRFTLPVLSISTDEDQLFDYTNGIYVAGKHFDDWRALHPSGTPGEKEGNFTLSGIDYERVANMSYFVAGKEVINQKIGIRIHGAYSRVFPCKSLSLYARSDYGDDNMSYKIFSDEPYASYERLTIRNYGSDYYNIMFRDALNAELVKDLRLETEAYQPIILFMNSEYWGILGFREKYDNNYFKQVYNIPNDQVDLLENDGYKIDEGDNIDYFDMYNNVIANKNLADDANFNIVKTRMDTDNFMDYFITNIFFQNKDWPGNNIIYWRKKTNGFQATAPYGHDGRWRWAIHDMDATYGNYAYDELAAATDPNGPSIPNPPSSTLILRKVLENNTFKIDFINRFADLMNTSFLSSRINAKIDSMAAVIAPEMNDQYFRWKAPVDASDWQYFLNQAKDFSNQRPDYQRQHIRKKFGISKNISTVLNVNDATQGYIKINTIDIKNGTPGITGNPYPWTGIYFHNIPLKLKAIAKPGFKFDHWIGASSSTQEEIIITPTDNFSITAVFAPTNEVSVPIYFWYMGALIPNGDQLTHLNSTYQLNTKADILYQSCIAGYPFPTGDPNNGKASMERRNQPTSLNYRPEANGNAAYSAADMKGLQIKEPLQKDGMENTLVFNISTFGYKKIKFSYAVINEGTNATEISVDYAINSGTPVWITTGLASTPLSLSSAYQLFESDFSSITTVDNNPNFKIRLRFTGSNMTVDSGLGKRVSFNNIAVDGVKATLSYPTPNVFTVGTTITNLTPSVAQAVNSYSISPDLSAGLAFNTSTGVISGTPTAASSKKTYTVTANYTGGTLTANLDITVNAPEQISLSYNTPNVFTKNTAISNLSPTVSGGTVTNYSIAPALPTGLSISNSTGVISGTPTVLSAKKTYTVTATTSGGSTTFALEITVNDSAPTNLSYTTPNVFTRNTAITNLSPTVGGGTVTNYSIAPALPTGLSISNSTGVISGTPTVLSAKKTYTVTATSSGGSTTFDLEITVNDVAPTNLSYNTPNVFTRNTAISNLSPTVSGGTVTNYSIAPALPTGLSISNSTGVISGTPTAVSAKATYTVTATTSGGSTTTELDITVNDSAPNSLSYTTPNAFTKNTAIPSLNPTVGGGTVTNYSITPDLPTGLSINNITGVISGTPTAVSAKATYTVNATNLGGSTSTELDITVNDVAPYNLSYPSPNMFTRNITITNLNPNVSGDVLSYEVTPSLPTGLNLNHSTGEISGTPTVIFPETIYKVTALNSGGSCYFNLHITVEENLFIDDIGLKKFKIYPNPFADLLNVAGINTNFSYKLFSMDRKLIKNESDTTSPIDLTGLPIGTYILELSSDDVTEIVRIIKNK